MRYQSAAAFDRSMPSVLRVGANRVVSASMYVIPYRLRLSVLSPGSDEASSRYKLDSEITSRTVAFSRVRTGLIGDPLLDRKSTRLNSSHITISYAVFCL